MQPGCFALPALVLTGTLIPIAGAPGAEPPGAAIDFGAVKYEKLATREATEARMIRLIQDRPDIEWGAWYQLGPFPGNERGTLAAALPPEQQLTAMGAGGKGPDLNAVYDGKAGVQAAWKKTAARDNERIDLKIYDEDRLNIRTSGYLYRSLNAAQDCTVAVTMGSDDGLRFWLNGELLIDADVPRGLNAEEHRLVLKLKKGMNHVLCKVTQGQGGWDYQLNNAAPLDTATDARLQAVLNRDFPDAEDAYYRRVTIPVPGDIVLEVGGLDVVSDGRAAVCTRRGDVYLVSGYETDAPFEPTFTLFASGLHEPLGLAARREKRDEDGKERDAVYCTQRGELTRMVDLDGDDRADVYETVCNDWGVSGNYHEFAFGPKFDPSGNAWVTLNVGFCDSLGKSVAPYRGWSVRIAPDGTMTPVCDGLRSPNGIGFLPDGAAFYLDNQGDYVGTNRMMFMAPGVYAGHPAGLRWREGWSADSPEPARAHATIWFPYKKMGQSAADFLLNNVGDRFGPFAGQVFVGDQTISTVMRCNVERVQGAGGVEPHYQGACFPFRSGLSCGVNRLCWDMAGQMLVGETDRGWGSTGRLRYGLDRVVWTGKVPFEPLSIQSAPDGFVVTFTREVDPATATSAESYRMASWTYEYHPEYGSAEMDRQTPKVVSVAQLSPTSVHLKVDGLREGGEAYVHEINMPGLRDAAGAPLLHPVGYYTLYRISSEMPTPPAVPLAAAR